MNKDLTTAGQAIMPGQKKMKVQQSPAFLRKRRMMLVLPLLVLPFITMAFWVLGGGKETKGNDSSSHLSLNLNLPDANLKDEKLTDKLSFYEKADQDSLKKQELLSRDPYYTKNENSDQLLKNDLELITQNTASKYNQHLNTSPYDVADDNPERELMKKLALLEKEMNRQPDEKNKYPVQEPKVNDNKDFAMEVDRLENLIQDANNTGSEDMEVQQLNGTLDKILDIQHPQRVKDRLKEKSMDLKKVVFAVTKYPVEDVIGLLDTIKRKATSEDQFFGTEETDLPEEYNHTMEAIAAANQVLVNGAIIKLRLTTDIYINGSLIPKGNSVNGIVSLNDERLTVQINSIRYGNYIFPVNLGVYDLDGLPGIYIPGAITRDVAKQSVDNGLQLMELASLDPSFKAQATSAGISTAKSLISKKIKQVKVMVKSGYKVLLKDKNIEL